MSGQSKAEITFAPYVTVEVTGGEVSDVRVDWFDTCQNGFEVTDKRADEFDPNNDERGQVAINYLDRPEVRAAVETAIKSGIGVMSR